MVKCRQRGFYGRGSGRGRLESFCACMYVREGVVHCFTFSSNMNRLRNRKSNTRGSQASASPTQKQDDPPPPDDFDPMEDDPRRKPAPELDLQFVSDDARSQFADILGRVEGKKDVVIQQELMSLLDHVTPMGFLRK